MHSVAFLPEPLAICRLVADAPIPAWAYSGPFHVVTRTHEELSIVCDEQAVPPGMTCERGWRALKVAGPLDFAQIGVLASLLVPLASAEVSVFAISTFDTDYLLVRDNNVNRAVSALRAAGHDVS